MKSFFLSFQQKIGDKKEQVFDLTGFFFFSPSYLQKLTYEYDS